jgi:hypothetical protein
MIQAASLQGPGTPRSGIGPPAFEDQLGLENRIYSNMPHPAIGQQSVLASSIVQQIGALTGSASPYTAVPAGLFSGYPAPGAVGGFQAGYGAFQGRIA